MNTIYDYHRFAILYVDDEEKSLKYFQRAFEGTFRIFTAPNAQEGFKILEDHQEEIGIVMSDQRMPGEKGSQFLERARKLRPQMIRILATAYSDLDAAIEAVNAGAIYKYVTKPWDIPTLETTLKRSLEFYIVQTERDILLREKLSALHRLVITDRVLSLGILAAGLGQHFRNSFDAIRTFLDLAPESAGAASNFANLQEPKFWMECHRKAQDQIRNVLRLLEDLGSETGEPFSFTTEIRLVDAANEAIKSAAAEIAERQLQVTNLIPADLPPVLVDARRFQKLFPFILREALQNVPTGGILRFEARHCPATDSKPEQVEIFVHDTSAGLPADAILSMIDPVVQRADPASVEEFGVLLMACYFIVHHHGGQIQIRSDSERGLALTLTLPVKPNPENTTDTSESFLVRAMTNDRLWERLLSGTF